VIYEHTFAEALAAGQITAGHVDALGRVLRGLEPLQRTELLRRADRLLQRAQTSTVEDDSRSLRRAASRFSDADLEARLVAEASHEVERRRLVRRPR
jgi:hypothetical protein